MSQIHVTQTIRTKIQTSQHVKIAAKILGPKYDLSIVLIADKLGKKLNKAHKGRDYPTNVLSFPITESSGEIFINVRRAEREAKKFDHTPKQHILYLLIHGCLHLTGLPHGKKMDALEQKYMRLL